MRNIYKENIVLINIVSLFPAQVTQSRNRRGYIWINKYLSILTSSFKNCFC